ncbi:MAG: hypothetical protein QXG50_04925 [Desulfurococcaceae archaeon]
MRVWRSLHLYKSSVLGKEAKRVRPWIVDYLVEAWAFSSRSVTATPDLRVTGYVYSRIQEIGSMRK